MIFKNILKIKIYYCVRLKKPATVVRLNPVKIMLIIFHNIFKIISLTIYFKIKVDKKGREALQGFAAAGTETNPNF